MAAAVNMEMLSFLTKFAELSCQGLSAKLWFTSSQKTISVNLKADLGNILPPSFNQPFHINARQRRRKRREAARNKSQHNDSASNETNDSSNNQADEHETVADADVMLSSYETGVVNEPSISCPLTHNSREVNEVTAFTLMNAIDQNVSSSSGQCPVNCIMYEEGCRHMIYRYYNRYTAICETCTAFLNSKLQKTPYDHRLCPCCHQPSKDHPLTLCTECLEEIHQDG